MGKHEKRRALKRKMEKRQLLKDLRLGERENCLKQK